MGNRCVITSYRVNKENMYNNLGVYLHWNGDIETVKNILSEIKTKDIRKPSKDPEYFWSRFCQHTCNIINKDGSTGVGIGIVGYLDTNNGDNGTYYIDDNLDIVKHTNGSELL